MQCDMCGTSTEHLLLTSVEGVNMNVCKDCSKYGKVLTKSSPNINFNRNEIRKPTHRRPAPIRIETEKMEMFITGYPQLIKKKREKLGLTQKELAKKLSEKESLIHHIESGKFEPSIEMGRKFEKFLHLKLIEEYEEEKKAKIETEGSDELTLGDIIKVRKK